MRRIPEIFGFYSNVQTESSIELCQKLFERAEKTVHIVAGELRYEFYADSRIVEILRRKLGERVAVEIIHGPDADPRTRALLLEQSDNHLVVYELEFRPDTHFMVIDGKHVRVEEPHVSGQASRAHVVFDTLFLAQELEDEFSTLRQVARQIR